MLLAELHVGNPDFRLALAILASALLLVAFVCFRMQIKGLRRKRRQPSGIERDCTPHLVWSKE
jgi:hypothetical protein